MDQATVQALFSAFIVVATMLLVGFPVHEFAARLDRHEAG